MIQEKKEKNLFHPSCPRGAPSRDFQAIPATAMGVDTVQRWKVSGGARYTWDSVGKVWRAIGWNLFKKGQISGSLRGAKLAAWAKQRAKRNNEIKTVSLPSWKLMGQVSVPLLLPSW